MPEPLFLAPLPTEDKIGSGAHFLTSLRLSFLICTMERRIFSSSCFWVFFNIIFIFRQRGREGEKERNTNVWLPLAHPPLGTWTTTQACALTGNRTSDSLVCRPALNPLSHTNQGPHCVFMENVLRPRESSWHTQQVRRSRWCLFKTARCWRGKREPGSKLCSALSTCSFC